jgi:hypothetical protein
MNELQLVIRSQVEATLAELPATNERIEVARPSDRWPVQLTLRARLRVETDAKQCVIHECEEGRYFVMVEGYQTGGFLTPSLTDLVRFLLDNYPAQPRN